MVARRDVHKLDTLSPHAIAGKYDANKYFASNQALIFIGPYLVDEVVAINYLLDQRKVPIYGYASQYYDALASGKVIVSGSLSINYIDSAYLYYAMFHGSTHNTSARKENYKSILDQARKRFDGATKAIADTLGQISDSYDSSRNNNKTKINSPEMRKIGQLISSNPIEGQRMLNLLRRKYWGSDSDTSRPTDATNISATELQSWITDVGSVNKDRVGALLHARPDQMPPINVVVSHGNPSDKNFSTYRVLRELSFLGVQQQISPTGQNQIETYNFIARTIEF